MTPYGWVGSAAFACGFVAVGLIIPLLRTHALDRPTDRSSHLMPTPRGGGLGLFLGAVAGLVIGLLVGVSLPMSVLLAGCGCALLGLADDFFALPAITRLAVQLVLAIVLVFGGRYHDRLGVVVAVVGVVFVVGFVNAYNFMDGINGISALSTVVFGIWYLYLGSEFAVGDLKTLAVVQIGLGIAFIPWNLLATRVFLGDAGSYLLGFLAAASALVAHSGGVSLVLAVAPLTVYLADTAWTIGKRACSRKSIFAAHREHTYQLLVHRSGRSHRTVAVWVVAVEIVASVMAALFVRYSVLVVVLWLALVGAYLALPRILGASRRS